MWVASFCVLMVATVATFCVLKVATVATFNLFLIKKRVSERKDYFFFENYIGKTEFSITLLLKSYMYLNCFGSPLGKAMPLQLKSLYLVRLKYIPYNIRLRLMNGLQMKINHS